MGARRMRVLAVAFLLLALAICTFGPMMAYSAPLPGQSAQLLPSLNNEISTYWPTLSPRSFPAGVIDQESNWKINAALKTSREYGCGLGQFTVAYDANGDARFDAIAETRRLDASLASWNWKDCQNTQYQLRAVVLKLRVNERSCLAVLRGNLNVKACDAAAYNGGLGSVYKRMRQCRATAGCIDTTWFNHLDKMCPQANVKVKGYGESFCMINSKYPGRVFDRLPKFNIFWPKEEVLSVPK